MEIKPTNFDFNNFPSEEYQENLDADDIYSAENDIIPFDDDQYSDPEYYTKSIKIGFKEKVKLLLSDIKVKHYFLLLFIVILFIAGVKVVLSDSLWGYFWIISSLLAFIGLILNILFYIRQSEMLFIIAGILSFPIGMLLIFVLEKNNKSLSFNTYDTVESTINLEVRTAKFTHNSLSKIYHFYILTKGRNFYYILISVITGFFLGWYFKVPNAALLKKLMRHTSLWKKDLALELERKRAPFISTEFFDFNWIVFIFSTLICFLLILYVRDDKFRIYVRNKFELLKSN